MRPRNIVLLLIALVLVAGCGSGDTLLASGEQPAAAPAAAEPAAVAPVDANPPSSSDCDATSLPAFAPDSSERALVPGGTEDWQQIVELLRQHGFDPSGQVVSGHMPAVTPSNMDSLHNGVVCPDGNVYMEGRNDPVITDAELLVPWWDGAPNMLDLDGTFLAFLPASEVLKTPCRALVEFLDIPNLPGGARIRAVCLGSLNPVRVRGV